MKRAIEDRRAVGGKGIGDSRVDELPATIGTQPLVAVPRQTPRASPYQDRVLSRARENFGSSKPHVVVAGQVPPPVGGQNVMIQKAVAQLADCPDCESVHLPFYFTTEVSSARRGALCKLVELVRVIGRLVRIRLDRPIDLMLYPVGGPQLVPLIRDLLLMPFIFLFSRRVVLHFHAAGIADVLANGPHRTLARMVAAIYRRAVAAVVMTEFNRRDPEAVGIKRVLVIPHRIEDEFDAALVRRQDDNAIRLLYVGHLCPDKGTPQLLEAFADFRQKHPELEVELQLELVGECLPPFGQEELSALLDRLRIRSHVRISGVLTGRAKKEAFGRADVFVFPTIAPYESFGLVLAEAMSWNLPIVASKWRGNLDVLTPALGGVTFRVTSSLAAGIGEALSQALQQRDQWSAWGERNRQTFLERYCERPAENGFATAVLKLLETDNTPRTT